MRMFNKKSLGPKTQPYSVRFDGFKKIFQGNGGAKTIFTNG